MASMTAEDKTIRRNGPAVYKVCGVVYRRIGSIMPPRGDIMTERAGGSDSNPKCVQTYFYDNEFQKNHRATRESTKKKSCNRKKEK